MNSNPNQAGMTGSVPETEDFLTDQEKNQMKKKEKEKFYEDIDKLSKKLGSMAVLAVDLSQNLNEVKVQKMRERYEQETAATMNLFSLGLSFIPNSKLAEKRKEFIGNKGVMKGLLEATKSTAKYGIFGLITKARMAKQSQKEILERGTLFEEDEEGRVNDRAAYERMKVATMVEDEEELKDLVGERESLKKVEEKDQKRQKVNDLLMELAKAVRGKKVSEAKKEEALETYKQKVTELRASGGLFSEAEIGEKEQRVDKKNNLMQDDLIEQGERVVNALYRSRISEKAIEKYFDKKLELSVAKAEVGLKTQEQLDQTTKLAVAVGSIGAVGIIQARSMIMQYAKKETVSGLVKFIGGNAAGYAAAGLSGAVFGATLGWANAKTKIAAEAKKQAMAGENTSQETIHYGGRMVVSELKNRVEEKMKKKEVDGVIKLELEDNLEEEKVNELVRTFGDWQARVRLSDSKRIDLFAYEKNVDLESIELTKTMMQLKVDLMKKYGVSQERLAEERDLRMKGMDKSEKEKFSKEEREIWESLSLADKIEKSKSQQMKEKIKGAVIGALIGAGSGVAMKYLMEIPAVKQAMNSISQSVAETGNKVKSGVAGALFGKKAESTGMTEGLYDGAKINESGRTMDQEFWSGLKKEENLVLVETDKGEFQIGIDIDGDGKSDRLFSAENLNFEDGKLTDQSMEQLKSLGFEVEKVGETMVAEPRMAKEIVSVGEYLEKNPNLVEEMRIEKFGEGNDLWIGAPKVENGKYVLPIMPRKNNLDFENMRVALGINQDTKNSAVMLDLKMDGRGNYYAEVPIDSVEGASFFKMTDGGNVDVSARYMAVVNDADGDGGYEVLASMKGQGDVSEIVVPKIEQETVTKYNLKFGDRNLTVEAPSSNGLSKLDRDFGVDQFEQGIYQRTGNTQVIEDSARAIRLADGSTIDRIEVKGGYDPSLNSVNDLNAKESLTSLSAPLYEGKWTGEEQAAELAETYLKRIATSPELAVANRVMLGMESPDLDTLQELNAQIAAVKAYDPAKYDQYVNEVVEVMREKIAGGTVKIEDFAGQEYHSFYGYSGVDGGQVVGVDNSVVKPFAKVLMFLDKDGKPIFESKGLKQMAGIFGVKEIDPRTVATTVGCAQISFKDNPPKITINNPPNTTTTPPGTSTTPPTTKVDIPVPQPPKKVVPPSSTTPFTPGVDDPYIPPSPEDPISYLDPKGNKLTVGENQIKLGPTEKPNGEIIEASVNNRVNSEVKPGEAIIGGDEGVYTEEVIQGQKEILRDQSGKVFITNPNESKTAEQVKESIKEGVQTSYSPESENWSENAEVTLQGMKNGTDLGSQAAESTSTPTFGSGADTDLTEEELAKIFKEAEEKAKKAIEDATK